MELTHLGGADMHKVQQYLHSKLSGRVFTWQEIVRLLIPGVLDYLSIMLIKMLITALISNNGETSTAAVAIVNPIVALTESIFMGIATGGSIVVAQCFGGGDREKIERSIGAATVITVSIGAMVCLPFIAFPHAILSLLYPDTDSVVMEKAVIYLAGCAWSIIPFAVYQSCFNVLRGLGESKRCLILSVVINVAYLVLSIAFLNILNMDVHGSTYALFLARIIGAVIAIAALFLIVPPVKVKFKNMLRFGSSFAGYTIKNGIPLGFEQVCISLGDIVSEMYMIYLGTTALSTHAIAFSVLGLIYAPSMSVGGLSVSIVGRCMGAGEYEEAYRYGKRCSEISLFLMVVSCILFFPLLPLILKQYTLSADAYRLVTRLLYMSILSLILFFPKSITLPSVFRAGGDTLYPTVMSMVALWLVTILLGYLLAIPAGMGLIGVWIALWSGWAVRSILFSFRYRSRKWLHISQVQI